MLAHASRSVTLKVLAGLLLFGLTDQAPARQPPIAGQQGMASRVAHLPGGVEHWAAESVFARLVRHLSEPGGYFDTDNLISNEASYLHVIGAMRKLGVSGGAYIGVGPDQNFSYIAQVRPRIAFIIDIRRDNLLQQLFYKSLFALARNRIEYLCLLFGRPLPSDARRWGERDIQHLIDYIDRAPPRHETIERARASVQATARSFGVPLTGSDLATIGRIHGSFIGSGLDLRFTSLGRTPRSYYPTYRQLLLETDLSGRHASYLASERDFQFVKSLQQRDLIIPVVGDLAGGHALAAIGRLLAARGERVSAFYTSNVEFYLMRDGGFDRFAENVKRLPRDGRSVIIRSYFGGVYGDPHPQAVPGYPSTQLLQTIESLVEEHESGSLLTYTDLVNKHALELR